MHYSNNCPGLKNEKSRQILPSLRISHNLLMGLRVSDFVSVGHIFAFLSSQYTFSSRAQILKCQSLRLGESQIYHSPPPFLGLWKMPGFFWPTKKTGIFLGCEKGLRDFFVYAKKSCDFFWVDKFWNCNFFGYKIWTSVGLPSPPPIIKIGKCDPWE